jgi:hypothetical protein
MVEPEHTDVTADGIDITSEVLELAKALHNLGKDGIYDMVWSINIKRRQRSLTNTFR